ncbi:MAG: SDR family NAD(P)-dependent oxidoreductase [Blastocatellia bacterium]
MRKILITGGAGFIGSHVADKLLRQGQRVVVIDNFDNFYARHLKELNIAPHLYHSNYRLVEADICRLDQLHNVFAEEHFDAVIHLAAKAGVRPSLEAATAYHETNVGGTINLLELCRLFEVQKFVFASSSSVYGPNLAVPFAEDAPPQPISPYASTKVAGEMYAYTYSQLYNIQTICLRFFTVYGARQRPDLAIHKFAHLMTHGKPIPVYGDGSSSRDYTYIDDICDGVISALDYWATKFEIVNLGEAYTITLKRLIELLETTLQLKAKITYFPKQVGDLPHTCADITKARQLLSYHPHTSIETGLAHFAKWFASFYAPAQRTASRH